MGGVAACTREECIFRRRLYAKGSTICNYALDMPVARGCQIEGCTKHISRSDVLSLLNARETQRYNSTQENADLAAVARIVRIALPHLQDLLTMIITERLDPPGGPQEGCME
jgi:hypothetical protein